MRSIFIQNITIIIMYILNVAEISLNCYGKAVWFRIHLRWILYKLVVWGNISKSLHTYVKGILDYIHNFVLLVIYLLLKQRRLSSYFSHIHSKIWKIWVLFIYTILLCSWLVVINIIKIVFFTLIYITLFCQWNLVVCRIFLIN